MQYFWPMFGLGLVTSIHCVAMCGMLVMTYAVKEGSEGSIGRRLTPHLAYQSAKILSYVAVGLILGAVGAAFDLAGIRGWVMLAAGLFMVLLGLNMTGKFPFLRRLTPKAPKALTNALSRTRKKANAEAKIGVYTLATPIAFGALTGLMPCGPLQAAQLSAAATGSAAAGAVAMFGFGLGTAPLMVAMGVGSGYVGGALKRRMNLVAAVAIIILGLVMFNRGSMLVGSPLTVQSLRQTVAGAPAETSEDWVIAEDGVAEIEILISDVTFDPEVVSIPADTPVRLIVDRQEDNTCSDQIAVPQMGILEELEAFGTTVVELPPADAGTYTLTCGMGMMSGRIVSGAASAGIGGSTIVAIGVLLLVTAGAMYAFWKRGPTRVDKGENCPNPGKGERVASAKLLGLGTQEIVLVVAAIAAAVIAGLAFGGMLG